MAKTEAAVEASTNRATGGQPPAAPDCLHAQTVHAQTLHAQSLHAQVRRIIDLIRPAVQSDGGDLELVDVSEDGTVRVRFHGACVGCPSSTMTLQAGIERSLRDRIPAVSRVEAVGLV
ncbi:MAG: NifU family protein [Phycisphaerales bacterium]